MKRNPQTIYDEVTQGIIAALEAGTVPWVCPWNRKEATKYGAGEGVPYNASTSRPYNGINVLLLWLFGPPGPGGYMTYRQAEKLGAQVRGGSKGYRVVYADSHTKVTKTESGEDTRESYYFLKRHTVFHVSQIDGLPEKYSNPPPLEYTKLDDDAFNLWVDNTGANIKPGGASACYMPTVDTIGMPPLQTFKSAEAYKAVLLHELGHWTGHKKRLDRGFGLAGSHDYAREELVAEMCAAFCCARLGVTAEVRHPDYIAHWIKVLREDNKAVFRAAAAAQKATDYLFSLQRLEPLPRSRALVVCA